jgi:hypothetical protein
VIAPYKFSILQVRKVHPFQSLMVPGAEGQQVGDAQIQFLDGLDGIDKRFAVQRPAGTLEAFHQDLGIDDTLPG